MNVDGKKVNFCVGSLVRVFGNHTQVTSNIYVPNGDLTITGSVSNDCVMSGTYIANRVISDYPFGNKYILWQKYDCTPPSASKAAPEFVATEKKEQVKQNETPAIKEFDVRAYPNPSSTLFNMQVINGSNEATRIRIMDITGKTVKVINNGSKSNVIQFGEDLIGGTYFAEVTQGKNVKVLKLIKLN